MAGGGDTDPTGGGLTVVIALLVAILSKEYMKRTPLPFTIIMLLFGVIFGFFLGTGDCEEVSTHGNITGSAFDCEDLRTQYKCEAMSSECVWKPLFYDSHDHPSLKLLSQSLTVWTTMDPHLIMYTFLPALIYASSSSMNFHVFMKSTRQILCLAGPGVLIATFLTAWLVKVFQPDDYNWTWASALALGSMLSATDPVAVVALLKEFNAPSNLGIVIEGESLFNDGTAFAIFLICFTNLKGETRDVGESIGFFLQLAGGGILLGWVLGWCMVRFIGHTQDGIVEVITTLVFAYGSFIFAEQIGVSGVLTVVLLGLEMARSGKPLMSDEHMMHNFWELMEFIANCVIFVICGLQMTNALMSTKDLSADPMQHLLFMGIIYLIITFVRVFTIAVLTPLYRWSGYGVRFSEASVMSWAGIRGAVSLTIAAMIAQTRPELFECDAALDDGCGESESADTALIEAFAGRMLFHCAGVTFLTLVVNGTTTGALVKYFKLGLQCTASQHAFDRVCREVSEHSEKKLRELKDKHPFFEHMDLPLVWDLLPIFNEEMLAERLESKKINAARYQMIDQSPFFKKMRQHYEKTKTSSDASSSDESGARELKKVSSKVVPFNSSCTSLSSTTSDTLADIDDVDDLLSDPDGLSAFAAQHWNEIVEVRRRSLNMLAAIYWHNYEAGLTTESGITVLLDAVDTVMDRQRRAPPRAPVEEIASGSGNAWNAYTIDSWSGIEESLRPSKLNQILVFVCKQFGCTTWSRYLLHFTFERTIDLANSFVLAHEKLTKRLEKLSADCAHVLADPTLKKRGVHVLQPLVVRLVAEESRAACRSAKKIIDECVGSQNNILKSVATKQAVRYLLKYIEHAVEHEVEEGNLDETEAGMMNTCTLFCQKRLRLGNSIPQPPSIVAFLKRIPFLRVLDEDMLRYVAEKSHERHVPTGSALFVQSIASNRGGRNESVSGLYLILAGSVSVFYRSTDRSAKTAKMIDSIHAAMRAGKKWKAKSSRGRWSVSKLFSKVSPESVEGDGDDGNAEDDGDSDREDELIDRGKSVGEFGANEVFGTLSFLTSRPHMMTVEASSMVMYLFVPADVVRNIFAAVRRVSIGKDRYFVRMLEDSGDVEPFEEDGATKSTSAAEADEESLAKESSLVLTDKDGDPSNAYFEKRSHVHFDKSHDFEISLDTATSFVTGCCRNAALHAALTVLEVDIITRYSIRPVEFRDLMTHAIEHATYLRVRRGEIVRLDRAFILLTGSLSASTEEGDDDDDATEQIIQSIRFVDPIKTKRSKHIYRVCGEGRDSTAQIFILSEEDVDTLSSTGTTRRPRRRLVQSLSRALSGVDTTAAQGTTKKRKSSLWARAFS